MDGINIIGIDCACDPKKVGLARGQLSANGLCLLEAQLGGKGNVQTIAEWSRISTPCLLAMDAPLGWPVALGNSLINHKAGDYLPDDADDLFHRETDEHIQRTVRKKPLEVGANLIARTAHSALRMLQELRITLGESIPLSWNASTLSGVEAIEVYPAATMLAHRITASKYKASVTERRKIIRQLLDCQMQMQCSIAALEASADVLDAAVCVLAGADFLRDSAVPPGNLALAQREGWIWLRRPVAT